MTEPEAAGGKPHGADAAGGKPHGVRCQAKSKQRPGEQCRAWAVHGRRVCYYHGGATVGAGRPIVHGRYSASLANHPALLERYEEFKADPKLTELLNEIALLRALLARYLQQFGSVEHPDAVRQISDLVDAVAKQVERKHRIDHGDAVTLTLHHYETVVFEVLETVKQVYGDDERFIAFLEALSQHGLTRGH